MQYQQMRQLLGLPDLLEVRSVLAIEPHPDDNEVGAGATLRLLAEQGTTIVYVTVTDGRLGSEDPTVDPDELVRRRRQERQEANQIIGVSRHYSLDLADAGHWTERGLMKKLVRIMREVRPDLIMTVDPWTPYEAHPDHVKTGRAAATAMIYCKNGLFLRGQGEPVHIPQIAFYGSSFPNRFVSVTNTWPVKLAALKAHRSQFDNSQWPLLSAYLTMMAETLGREHCGGGYAEGFKVMADMALHFFPDAVRS